MKDPSEQLVVWHIGFAGKPDFFRLHCPANMTRRLSMCNAAITTLKAAWPHLTVSETMEDIDTYQQ